MPMLFIKLSAMFYIKKTQHKLSKDFICLVDDCESYTENNFITESEDCFEEVEKNIAVPLASNLEDVVQKVRKLEGFFGDLQ